MPVIAIVSTNTITINGAQWGGEEAALRLWCEQNQDSISNTPGNISWHQGYLDEGETITLVESGLNETGEKVFFDAFLDHAPDGVDEPDEKSGEIPNPWGAPWCWADEKLWYKPQLTAAQMGRRWAVMNFKKIEKELAERKQLEEEFEETQTMGI